MRVKFFVSLAAALACLLLGSLLFAETARPPQQERQKFMPEGVVEHKAGSATVAANDPRPLAQAVSAMREEYGWLVDYEDPPYMSDAELVDDTDPQWRASHPNAPGVRRVAGGAFKSEYQESAGETTRGGQEAVLRKIVSEYNRSGNPGKFTVRLEEEGRFAVVGLSIKNQAGQDQNVTPVLDTLISVPAKQLSAGESIGAAAAVNAGAPSNSQAARKSTPARHWT